MSTEELELRPLRAGRLLEIRRAVRAQTEDGAERAALCNAQVLAEACFSGEEAAFPNGEAVLAELTFGEMESLLRRLGGGEETPRPGAVNPRFDPARFHALREG
jgi:hypothetical protein